MRTPDQLPDPRTAEPDRSSNLLIGRPTLTRSCCNQRSPTSNMPRGICARRVVLQYPSALAHLALALQLDGRGVEALEHAHEALALDLDLDLEVYGPDYPQVQTDRTIIDQLRYTVVVR